MADRQVRLAEACLARRDYAGARTHIERALSLVDNDASMHFLAARTARRTGNYEDAESRLLICERLGWPRDEIAMERALRRAQNGDLPAVEASLQHMVDALDHPDSIYILEALARGYHKTFQYGNALHALDLWLQRRPDDVQALLWRGEIHETLNHGALALADYHRAVDLAPDDDEATWRLAQGLLRDGQPKLSAEQFERLLQRRTNQPGAVIGLARCRRAVGEVDEAKRLLDQFLVDHPDDAGALAERGELALQSGELEQAETLLRRAVARAPLDRAAKYNLAQCLRRPEQKDEASALLAEVERGAADDKQLQEVTDRVHRSPRQADPRAQAGDICLRLGRVDEALLWYTSALRLEPRHRATHEALAAYFDRQGDHATAERHRRFTGGQTP
jgi:tetratricopeptide (TPR) repeat protein